MTTDNDSRWVPPSLREDLKRATFNYIMREDWFVHDGFTPDEYGYVPRNAWSSNSDREKKAHFIQCGLITPPISDVTIEAFEDTENTGSYGGSEKVSIIRITPMRCTCGQVANIAVRASLDYVMREIIIASLR